MCDYQLIVKKYFSFLQVIY